MVKCLSLYGVEGDFSVTLWSESLVKALDLDLDQAVQLHPSLNWSWFRIKMIQIQTKFSQVFFIHPLVWSK